jgi:formate dehydrogenase subunit gamma
MKRPSVVRFSAGQRVQHLTVMILFVALVLTGFPQKFPHAPWAQGLVDVMGGLSGARFLHRAAGLAFAALAIGHLGLAALRLLARRQALTLVPGRKDFRDVVANLRYYLGAADAPPLFDRFDYREKFEYWGMAMGAVVMTLTGLVLYFPLRITHLLPGEVIPVAKVTHSNEGLLAFLVVIVWHIFNVHLAPEIFPFSTTIFTGRITVEQLRHHHPLEHARLFGDAAAPAGGAATESAEARRAVRPGYYWSPSRWEVVVVGKEAGTLPGAGGERFLKVPALAVLALAPLLGLALAMFVPAAGFAALAAAAVAAARQVARVPRRVATPRARTEPAASRAEPVDS